MKYVEMFFMICCTILAMVLSIATLVKPYYDSANLAELNAANKLIHEVIEDWESFYDVTAEGDAYQEWIQYQN